MYRSYEAHLEIPLLASYLKDYFGWNGPIPCLPLSSRTDYSEHGVITPDEYEKMQHYVCGKIQGDHWFAYLPTFLEAKEIDDINQETKIERHKKRNELIERSLKVTETQEKQFLKRQQEALKRQYKDNIHFTEEQKPPEPPKKKKNQSK